MSIEYIGYIYAMFVNSAMWNDHYSDTDIYSVVKEGKWTLDKLAEYAENVYVDVNGNGEVDNDDSFGVVMQKGHVLNGMAFASNVVYTSYDENGMPYISVNNEHTIDVFNKLHSLFYSSTGARMLENGEFDGLTEVMFPARRLLFCPNQFQFAGNEKIREMEDNFYIIPMPKYDENQENYYAPSFGAEISVLLKTLPEERKENVGMLLEALAYDTNANILPEYKEVLLKTKLARDNESEEMIDIILNSISFDFGINAWQNEVGVPIVQRIYVKNDPNVASTLAKMQKSVDAQIKKLVEKLGK